MASIRPLYSPLSPLNQGPASYLFVPSVSCKQRLNNSTPASPSISRQIQNQGPFAVSVAFNPSGNLDFTLFDDETSELPPPPIPPTEGRYEVVIDNGIIRSLDLTPFQTATRITSPSSVKPREYLDRTIGFTINYEREDQADPRELSEFPDIRLWFIRLDTTYPWLPVLLDWRGGELARYAAMLVPHQMSMRKGLIFNPEALELFVMNKVFVVYSWLKEHDIPKPRLKSKDMARMLGFGIGDELFDSIDKDEKQPISGS